MFWIGYCPTNTVLLTLRYAALRSVTRLRSRPSFQLSDTNKTHGLLCAAPNSVDCPRQQ